VAIAACTSAWLRGADICVGAIFVRRRSVVERCVFRRVRLRRLLDLWARFLQHNFPGFYSTQRAFSMLTIFLCSHFFCGATLACGACLVWRARGFVLRSVAVLNGWVLAVFSAIFFIFYVTSGRIAFVGWVVAKSTGKCRLQSHLVWRRLL